MNDKPARPCPGRISSGRGCPILVRMDAGALPHARGGPLARLTAGNVVAPRAWHQRSHWLHPVVDGAGGLGVGGGDGLGDPGGLLDPEAGGRRAWSDADVRSEFSKRGTGR